jgi:hypothetical protein
MGGYDFAPVLNKSFGAKLAHPFDSATVMRAGGRLYPQDGGALHLTACDRTLPRARPCPDGYAIRLDARYDGGREILRFVETAASFEDDETTK